MRYHYTSIRLVKFIKYDNIKCCLGHRATATLIGSVNKKFCNYSTKVWRFLIK